MKFETVPLDRKEASAFVESLHRHHKPAKYDKYRVGAAINGKLVGVVQVGRPVSRHLDDGKTLEVLRLCTDGTADCCSFLYAKAARIAAELGYSRIITYILESESGVSLKASGWQFEQITQGGTWDNPGRPRKQTAPTCPKKRYSKMLKGEADTPHHENHD